MGRTLRLGMAGALGLWLGLALAACGDNGGRSDGGTDARLPRDMTDDAPASCAGCNAYLIEGTFDLEAETVQGQANGFRISALDVNRPSQAENTDFGRNVSAILDLSISGAGQALGIPQLNLVVSFSSTAPGQPTTLTICQADEMPAKSGTYVCRTAPAPVSTHGSFDAQGNLTASPVSFTFTVGQEGAATRPFNFTLHQMQLGGVLNTASSPAISGGSLRAKLSVAELCAITVEADALQSFCQTRTVNLLDMIDGPAGSGCGQDMSASWMGPSPACSAGNDASHHAPDTTL